ncbi:MAG TPA: ABC transporter ATP-binding protein [Candidatus Dormibacteraeota bacterium]|nr:ABC transporter ATP-binding protein [Candidatus Dormibacteraeota bacterium]
MEPVVELIQARKRYGSVEALRGVDLTIHRGEVVAMLGPNGAGKTTSINLMLGLRRPTSGQVRLFGRDPGDRRARSRCGVMLQESGVPMGLRVRELVETFRAYYPNPMPTARVLTFAGLEAQAHVPANKLSGGQLRRLYYALSICGDPELLFLDEPTVGLDVESRRAFLDTIEEFAAEGKTIVLTTHYLEEADRLARRVIVIDQGRIIADAPPSEIKSQVAGKRVRFDCVGPIDEAALRGLPYRHLELRGGHVQMLTNQPEEVLREVFQRGLVIRNLEVVGADLEEAFLALTARRAPELVEVEGRQLETEEAAG